MRNLLEEFHANHGLRPPSILGVREHVFTGRYDIQSVMLYMIDKELDNDLHPQIMLTHCMLDGATVSRPWLGSCQIKKLAL